MKKIIKSILAAGLAIYAGSAFMACGSSKIDILRNGKQRGEILFRMVLRVICEISYNADEEIIIKCGLGNSSRFDDLPKKFRIVAKNFKINEEVISLFEKDYPNFSDEKYACKKKKRYYIPKHNEEMKIKFIGSERDSDIVGDIDLYLFEVREKVEEEEYPCLHIRLRYCINGNKIEFVNPVGKNWD